MASLRFTLLSFIRNCNDKSATVTIGSILSHLRYPKRGSIEATLNFLLKEGYVSTKGTRGLFHYFLTIKGLDYLRKKEYRAELSDLESSLIRFECYM
jgi:DNA-binding PadR family transcriptional regulator